MNVPEEYFDLAIIAVRLERKGASPQAAFDAAPTVLREKESFDRLGLGGMFGYVPPESSLEPKGWFLSRWSKFHK